MKNDTNHICEVTDKEAKDYARNFVTGIQNSILSSMNLNQNNGEASSLNNEKWSIHFDRSRRDKNRRCNSFQAACFDDTLESSCFTNFINKNDLVDTRNSLVGNAESSCHSVPGSNFRKIEMICSSNEFYQPMYQTQNSFQQNDCSSAEGGGPSSFKNIQQDSVLKYGKMCPICFEINDEKANWCMECGKAIVSVEIRRYDAAGVPQQPYSGYSSNVSGNGSNSLPAWENSYSPSQHHFPQEQLVSGNDHTASSNINSLMEDMKISCQFANMLQQQTTQKEQSKNSISFDFENPQFDDINNDGIGYCKHHAVYRRSSTGGEKCKDKEDFYAFDDLLYPDFAIYDPNLGYALPSSNIVSNGIYFHQNPYQTSGMYFPESSIVKKNVSKKRPNSCKKKRKHKKYKSQITNQENHSPNDFMKLKPNHQQVPQNLENEVDECYWKLPDEISLYIFSYLPMKDILSCLQVCQSFHKIASDNFLWKEITLKKHSNLDDKVLMKIAKKYPSSISLIKCNGKNVSVNGLRHLFRMCSDSLQKLDVSYCHGGVFIGDVLLLHAGARCKNIRILDVSWTNVSNASVKSLSDASQRLEKLHLNGCQGITDDCLIGVVNKHGESLRELEVLGCFKISFLSTNAVSQQCKKLTKLNLGQCHKVTNGALSNIAENLKHLEVLDIRGCKQIKDISMRDVAANCQHLKTIIIANCPLITDATLGSIAESLPYLQCIDVCGCGRISDRGVIMLAKNCRSIKTLDLSSTKVTHKSVSVIGSYCKQSMMSLKLSFCHSITDQCLRTVVSKCKKLQTLHLYGCKSLRYLSKLVEMNPKLKIERESLR